APHFTEALFDFGSGDKVVGVSAADARPAEATAIPRPVTADGFTPDPAAIIALDPHVVITSLEGGEWKQPVRQAGIHVVTLRASGLEDAARDLRIVGRISGFALSADKLAARMHSRLKELDLATVKTRPKVFVETAYPPPATAEDSYMTELITAAGGVMLVPGPGYTVVSGEQLQEMAPEVIVIGADPDSPPERPEYARLTAAGTRLVYVPPDTLFLPGPRLLEAIELISKGIQSG
ncbi:MAG TPA: ABC transporter substrate-binding protein, partial [Actinomycetota bacterium]|nr:ABC transporter substrate-binding protein [Actinomycetota bacterium]